MGESISKNIICKTRNESLVGYSPLAAKGGKVVVTNFVTAGRLRQKVLTLLEEEPKGVSELSQKINALPQSISRTLRELREKELVHCITPNSRKSVYELTERGRKILEKISEEKTESTDWELESKISSLLRELDVQYTNRTKLQGSTFSITSDFLLELKDGSKLAIEMSPFYYDRIKSIGCTMRDLKETIKDLEVLLVIRGETKPSEKQFALKMQPTYFDRVFFEDKLGGLEKYLNKRLQ